ncbi:MAG TPA: type II toxin-antitoxin system PemK/MazF family toxin [Rhizomicrobium sp.]
MTYKRWDVVAINFPFIEGTDSKRRPGVIVSSDRLYADHGIYWIAMVTTAKAGIRQSDIAISNLEKAGLRESCVIRVARITAVSDSLIDRRLGEITSKDRNAVIALLRQFVP